MKRIIVKVKYGKCWANEKYFPDNEQGWIDANIEREYFEILSTPAREVKIEPEN
jgi:hypothetical protein